MLMEVLSTIGALLFVFFALGFCIFSHELGHFLAARWRKLHVDAFALGFKPFWRKKIRGVEYRLGYLPFGGYCEIPQVDATSNEPKAADGTVLPRARAIDRIITAAAGPVFNVLSGLLIAVLVWYYGLPQDTPKMREITVLSVAEDSPEYAAGLRRNDKIVKLNGSRFQETWMGFAKRLLFIVGEVDLEVVRGKETLHVRYLPQVNPAAPESLRDEEIAWPFFTPLIPMQLEPEPGGPAAVAGVRSGDIVTAVNGDPVNDYIDFQTALDLSDGKPVTLGLLRDGEMLELAVTPVPVSSQEEYTRYLVGIKLASAGDGKVAVTSAMPGYPAAAAGVQAGDLLLAVDDEAVGDAASAVKLIQSHQERPMTLQLQRDGRELAIKVAPKKVTVHHIGVSVLMLDHPTPFQQLLDTIEMSYKSLRGIIIAVGNALGLTEQQSAIRPSHMSGPLGMGTVLFNSVHQGSLIAGVYFMVVISFALAIFNLLPLPVLDGGHIFFGLIELVFRRPLPNVVIKWLSNIFVVLLIALMLYVTFFDGRRLLRQHWRSGSTPSASGEQP